MRPEKSSRVLLAITRSKAKMFEYGLPESEHIKVSRDPARLLRLAVGMLGDLAAAVSQNGTDKAGMAELSSPLQFAARYFDAYAASELAQASDGHLLLLASATYYLCDFPGSAGVLVSRIRREELDLGAGGLDRLLWWLLRGELTPGPDLSAASRYQDAIGLVSCGIREFYGGREVEGAIQAAAMKAGANGIDDVVELRVERERREVVIARPADERIQLARHGQHGIAQGLGLQA